MPTTRFAPSPSGRLHLGHAYSAWFANDAAAGGDFLVRFEDIDQSRSRQEYVDGIFEDLEWLGLPPSLPPVFQSQRTALYEEAFAKFVNLGLIYPCFCTRKEISEEVNRMPSAPHGPDGPLYPGTCKFLDQFDVVDHFLKFTPCSWRLDSEKAAKIVGDLEWTDLSAGTSKCDPLLFGDPILKRSEGKPSYKTGTFSYHLCVVVDDSLQGVDLVTRGLDLLPSTHLHRLLIALLDLNVPTWHHHPLVIDETGKRLAKRFDSLAISTLREQGLTPSQVLEMAQKCLQLP